MFIVIALLLMIFAYLIGSINTSVILSRRIYGEDVRDSGSGNAGATNMLRTYGTGVAVLTLVCDVLKGVLPVILVRWLDPLLAEHFAGPLAFDAIFAGNMRYIAGLLIVVGHIFPVWFGFRGGKGVATSLGVILALDWRIGLTVLAAALLIMIFSRYVSLGSVIAAFIYPFAVMTFILADGQKLSDNAVYLSVAFLLAFLVIIKHSANISRLIHGTENKLFAKKEKNGEE